MVFVAEAVCQGRSGIMGKVLVRMENLLTKVSIAAVFVMACLTTFDAAGRYLLNAPIPAANEITAKYFMVFAIFFGLCAGYHGGSNIRVTFLVNYFPRRFKLVVDHIVQILSVLSAALLVICTVRLFLNNLHIGMLDAPNIPVGPAYLAAPVGLAAFTLWLVYDVPRVRKGKSDLLKEENEGDMPTSVT
jgi:TRAP-type C4-dicarboxylate transport system permease small subunit